MTEKELIGKIRRFSQIKPSKDWVSLTKNQILGSPPTTFYERSFLSIFYLKKWWGAKPAFAGLMTIFVLFGVFSFAQGSLPGDILYPLRKIVEKGQAVFVSSDEKPVFQLKLANERLEDLVKAPVKNLAPTINEFQVNVSEAAKNLAKMDATTSSPIVTQQIIKETKKLKENEQIAKSFGMVIEGEEIENFDKAVVKYLIDYLENRTLTEEKETILSGMKELFKEGKYSEALELYLINQPR